MKKKLKILFQLSEEDKVRLKYQSASLELDPEFYELPSDLTNLTPKDQRSIINQVKADLSITDLDSKDYEVRFRNQTIIVMPKEVK